MSECTGEAPVSYIRDVWTDTLEGEMATIRDLVQLYPYVSMVRPRRLLARGVPRLLSSHLRIRARGRPLSVEDPPPG